MKINTEAKKADALDPLAQKLVDLMEQLPSFEDFPPEITRSNLRERGNPFAPKECELARIEDRTIPSKGGDLKIRIYQPKSESSAPKPALVYYHGGGFVLGDIEGHDTVTQNLAVQGECVVVSVEYRLAPETKFPGGVEDAFDAFQWVVSNAESLRVNPSKVAVGGDSAGGNLAAVTALRCRDEKVAIPAFQLLIYPVTEIYAETASMEDFAKGYFLTRSGMDWFWKHYLAHPDQANDPMVSPLKANDLSNLPPALVITAGFDPLRDEGKAYADRLGDSGVQVTHLCYEDMIHGFVSFAGGMPQGMDAIKQSGAAIKKALS